MKPPACHFFYYFLSLDKHELIMFLTLFSNIYNYLAATYSALERLNVILHAAKDAVIQSLAQTSFKKYCTIFKWHFLKYLQRKNIYVHVHDTFSKTVNILSLLSHNTFNFP